MVPRLVQVKTPVCAATEFPTSVGAPLQAFAEASTNIGAPVCVPTECATDICTHVESIAETSVGIGTPARTSTEGAPDIGAEVWASGVLTYIQTPGRFSSRGEPELTTEACPPSPAQGVRYPKGGNAVRRAVGVYCQLGSLSVDHGDEI